MSRYLLTCSCGKTVPVEVGQAGGSVLCSCGMRLDVPTLRNLRHLPLESQPKAARASAATGAAWNARKGVVSAFLVLAAISAVYALYNRLTEPTVPEFDPAAFQKAVDQNLDALTPAQGYQQWTGVVKRMAETGFTAFEHPHTEVIHQVVAERRFFQNMMLIVAAICAAIAIIALLWPRATPTRR